MAHAAHSHDSHAGGHEEHHAHVIVPPITLKLVLGVLLGLTVLTVATAQLEVWAMNYFDIVLPAWVNVTGAMLIATVKAVLVMAYFMQLRYDNPMNTVVMLFTFFAVGLFLFFTSLDLFTRDRVYDYKATAVVAGGTGERVGLPSGTPLVVGMKQKALETMGAERYEYVKSQLHHGKHGHGGEDTTVSNANRSRPRVGLTVPSSTQGDGHGEKSAGEAKSGH